MKGLAIPEAPFVLQAAATPAACLEQPLESAPQGDLVRLDIGVRDGDIAFLRAPGGPVPEDWKIVPMAGRMVWPCFTDAHAHIDSAQICERSPNLDGAFAGAQAAMFSDRDRFWTADDMRRRMDFGLRCAWAHGTGAIRTHLASQNEHVETRWAIFRELRQEWAGRIDLQAASLISTDALAEDAVLTRTVEAARGPGGVLGAFAPAAPGLRQVLEKLFDAAERHGLALDFHADETADPASTVLTQIAETAIARRFQGPILVGHGCSLANQDPASADRTLDLVAWAGLGIVALPACNLHLQDRQQGRTPRWRGVTLLHELRTRGVRVAIGSDNCRDGFYPYGDYDMLEVFRDATRIAHLDHPVADWPGAVSRTAAAIIGAPCGGLAVGTPADLILFKARSFSELLSRPQSDRTVLRGGHAVDAPLPDFAELDPTEVP